MSDDDIKEIRARLDAIEAKQKRFTNLATHRHEEIDQFQDELRIIIHGSDRLGVPPLLDQVRELYRFYDRAKWAFGALGVSNIGIIITWLATIIGRSLP